MSLPAPRALVFMVADAVHRDDLSGRRTVAGTRPFFLATSMPWVQQRIAFYAVLANGRGGVPIRIRIIDANEEGEPVAEIEEILEFSSPLEEVEAAFEFLGAVFPQPGWYRAQLFAGDTLLSQRRLLVHLVERNFA
ncbi:MAG: hypothetical protein K2W96_05335 [Gemmataceae bacterium]|nr:hypothetical protein [Gemmataceae bacterium]